MQESSRTQHRELAEDILAAAAILSRGSESVRAVMKEDPGSKNRFTNALIDLQRISEQENIPIAIVGGLAAIRYGYPAATQDIDIAIAIDQLEHFLEVAPAFGFKIAWNARSNRHTVTHGDVEINIVPEGGRANNDSPTMIPGPKQLGVERGLSYASLPGWMELKISSGRRKDHAHVVEVLKKTDNESIAKIESHLSNVHEDYLKTFKQLLAESIKEQQQEKDRGH